MSLFKTYIRKPWVIAIVVIVLLLVVGGIAFASRKKTTFEDYTVKSATVTEGVSITGNVKSAEAVDLSFEKTGTVARVAKDVGDSVAVGDIIVSISNADVRAELAEAEAAVKIQQAKLDELEIGTRPEAVAVTAAKEQSAEDAVTAARLALNATLQAAYSSTDDAIHNKSDEVFTNPRSAAPHLIYATFDPAQEAGVESGRAEVETRLNRLVVEVANASSSTDISASSLAIQQDIAEAKLFLDNLAFALNQSTLPTQVRNDLATARTEVTSAISSILVANQNYISAQSALTVAQNQLVLDQSGSVSDDITEQKAQVASAQANVESVGATLAKTYLTAPIAGIVTKQNAKLGQVVAGNTPVVSIISNAQFEMDAYVAEADISKIKVGEAATVTLDAYGPDVTFNAVVVSVDPAETIVDNVPTYKTTLQFNAADDRIKSGMTANIDISGDSHANVLAVPGRAIITHNSKKYVNLKVGNTYSEVQVTTGLRGEDGTIEIMSGLKEGDTIGINAAGS